MSFDGLGVPAVQGDTAPRAHRWHRVDRPDRLRGPRSQVPVPVEILAVATATPARKGNQRELARHVCSMRPEFAEWEDLFTRSGIETRYLSVPVEWYEVAHSWAERMDLHRDHSLELFGRIVPQLLEQSGLTLEDIDALVLNTTAGISVPTLDALLINRLGMRRNVKRLPIYGLGCSGGLAGLVHGSYLARALPGSRVLVLTVDLCSLAIRPDDRRLVNFVATALFGDGAAGLIVQTPAVSSEVAAHVDRPACLPRVLAAGEHLWEGTEGVLALSMTDDGFQMDLGRQLPELIRNGFATALNAFLDEVQITRDDLDGFLVHGGGPKILDGVAQALGLPPQALARSREVMRDFGNMSSATILFTLERAVEAGVRGRHLLVAFGFGVSAHFAVVDL
jgi:alkylresorcinol/alkylpyrone synthase